MLPERLALTISHVGSIVVNITMLSDQLAHTLNAGVLNTTEEADIANFQGTVE
jgi:hypothetical protein